MGMTAEDYDYDSADELEVEVVLDVVNENQGGENDGEDDEEDSDYLEEEEEEVVEEEEDEEPDDEAEDDDGVEDDDAAEEDDEAANEEEEEEEEEDDNVNANMEDDEDYDWWRLPDERGEPPGNIRTFGQIRELLEDNDAASKSGDMPQDYIDDDDIDTLVQQALGPIGEKWFTSKKKRNRFEKSRCKNSRQSEATHRMRSRSPHRKRATKSCL